MERFPVLLTDSSAPPCFSKIESEARVGLAYSAIFGGGEAHPLITPPEIGTPRLADISARQL